MLTSVNMIEEGIIVKNVKLMEICEHSKNKYLLSMKVSIAQPELCI